jgi:hypothetical protein
MLGDSSSDPHVETPTLVRELTHKLTVTAEALIDLERMYPRYSKLVGQNSSPLFILLRKAYCKKIPSAAVRLMPVPHVQQQSERLVKPCGRFSPTVNAFFVSDAPRALQVGFQDPATSRMEGIIMLHQNLSLFLLAVIILVG